MTYYNICTNRKLYHLQNDPTFWKGLKADDVVCGREVNSTAQDMKCCGWPLLDDLMDDEGTGWMVCRCVPCEACDNIIKGDDLCWQDDMGDYCSKECLDAKSFSAECVCGITCVCDCGCAESGVCGCGPSCPCPCGCGVEIETHDTESFEAPPSSRESKVARAMKTRSSGKSRGKKKGPFVFPARKAYPIGDMSHAKRALIFSTWPDNTQDAEKVRDAVFKRYPKLRDWFLDGKYAKHAESFEAEVCPCGCAMVGCVCSPSCKGECLGAESFEAEKIEGQTQSNIYAKFFVGHVSNDELRGNGKFKTYDSAVKKAKEVAKKEGNSRVVSPMGAALWTSNDKGLFQAGHLTKEAKRFYNSEEEMAVGYLSAESALYEAPMSVYDEYCIRQGPFCVMDRMPGKTLCVKCDEEFGEMFPHEAEYTALGVPTRRISASEIMSPTMKVLRNMFLIGGALFLITAVSASPPKGELLPTGNIEDVKMED